MRKSIKTALAAAAAGVALTGLAAAPAEAAAPNILFSNSDYNRSLVCSVKNSAGAKVYRVKSTETRKVNAKTGQVKCDKAWYARTFGRAKGSALKKNQWYAIGGQSIPLSWIVAEQK